MPMHKGLSGEELDHTPLTFGKYKGQTPSQIAEHDPSYITWIAENMDVQYCSDVLIEDCAKG